MVNKTGSIASRNQQGWPIVRWTVSETFSSWLTRLTGFVRFIVLPVHPGLLAESCWHKKGLWNTMTTMFKATMFKAKRTAQRLQPAGHWKLNLPLHGTAWHCMAWQYGWSGYIVPIYRARFESVQAMRLGYGPIPGCVWGQASILM